MPKASIPTMLRCLRCGHQWQPRTPNPESCPKCKSYEWDSPKPVKHPKEVTP